MGADFRKPLHMILSDAGICKVNTVKRKKKKKKKNKKKTVCKQEGSRSDIPEAGENRKGTEDPAGNVDGHPAGNADGHPPG